MAKKSEAESATETRRRRVAKGRADLPVSQDAQQRVPTTKLKPSALLDTRVVYCGDNLEQLAKLPDACGKQMQKEEGRMMKSAHFPILHSSFILLNSPVTGSFYYHCDWHASHYVLVKADVAALN
jgi:hypothetical protein